MEGRGCELRICLLEQGIEQWAVERDLRFDCVCKNHLLISDIEPGNRSRPGLQD